MKKIYTSSISKIVVAAIFAVCFSEAVIGQVVVNELLASNQEGITDEDGEHSDWIELYNTGTDVIDLAGYGISDDPDAPFQWVLPEVTIEGGEYLLIFASGKDQETEYLHTNFKLSSDGETVVLTNPNEVTVDEITFPSLNPSESYGRSTEDPNTWLIFIESTPLEANNTEGYLERLPDPELVLQGGFYPGSIEINLTDPSIADKVYMTVDGSEPTINSVVFGQDPRTVSSTFALKFRTIEEGKLSSNIVTETYFIGEEHDLPVISLSTDPDNFFSDETGIYVEGTNGIEGHCANGPVNWNQDWERPVHIELYETDGTKAFSSDAGTKIFGGCSRTNPQKSLSIFFRGEYGNPELNYKLFEEKEIETFQAFVLRNSGNDFTSQGHSMFRDGLMKTLIEDTQLDYQAFRPAVVYLNGEYWGIHNIREKINEHFIESNSNAESDKIDLLESNSSVIHGTAENYTAFLGALDDANMQNPEEYQAVEDMIDIDNYIDYMTAQIYYANTDWPGNNIKYWRNQLSNQGWRWIIYDTDFGFGLSYGGHYNHNTLDFALEPNGPGWPNPPWSTYVLRRLVESDIFVHKFVNRMSDLMNTVFLPDYVHDVIDSLSQKIESEMPDHIDKWGNSMGSWENQIGVLKSFANARPDYMKEFLIEQFGLSEPGNITVDVPNEEQGFIQVNRIVPKNYPWTGEYFGGVPFEITAIPRPGFTFSGWSGDLTSTQRTIQVQLQPGEELNLTANFVNTSGKLSDIVINEIMYNAPDEKDPQDWVELYNPNSDAINLSGWVLKDDDNEHEFIFPENTIITEKGYLVIAEDQNDFFEVYNNDEFVTGDMDFGLGGGGDQVRLYNVSGALIDSVEYDDTDPWPTEPDGNGYSLELKDHLLDNEYGGNWTASLQLGGTPGSENGIITSGEKEEDMPTSISLKQNYPNPFNPSTVISFQLTENSEVCLEVFDMLGRKVASLIDGERKSAGVHYITFNAGNLASGIYIYSLQAGDLTFNKKMLLVK